MHFIVIVCDAKIFGGTALCYVFLENRRTAHLFQLLISQITPYDISNVVHMAYLLCLENRAPWSQNSREAKKVIRLIWFPFWAG